jgi:hypothetical protein
VSRITTVPRYFETPETQSFPFNTNLRLPVKREIDLAVVEDFPMAQAPTDSVAAQVRRLAEAHNVTADLDAMSRMAVAIPRLAGDVVELDNVEQLLVNLKRKGILSKSEILILHGTYLQEKRRAKKRFETC